MRRAAVEHAVRGAEVGVIVDRRMLVLRSAVLCSQESHIHVNQWPVDVEGIRIDRSRPPLAAPLRSGPDPGRYPVGSRYLSPAQVHPGRQGLPGLEVHEAKAAIDLVPFFASHSSPRSNLPLPL